MKANARSVATRVGETSRRMPGPALALLVGIALVAPVAALARPRPGDTVDPAAIALYREADRLLLDRIRGGLRADVGMELPDGTRLDGYDEYVIDDHVRLREVRGAHEAVAVDTDLCTRAADAPFLCQDTEAIQLGLRPVHDDRVYRAGVSTVSCGTASCRQVEIEERDIDAAAEARARSMGMPTDPASRYVLRLVVRADGLPASLEETRLDSTGPIEPRAVFTFDYAAPVAPIVIPVPPVGG